MMRLRRRSEGFGGAGLRCYESTSRTHTQHIHTSSHFFCQSATAEITNQDHYHTHHHYQPPTLHTHKPTTPLMIMNLHHPKMEWRKVGREARSFREIVIWSNTLGRRGTATASTNIPLQQTHMALGVAGGVSQTFYYLLYSSLEIPNGRNFYALGAWIEFWAVFKHTPGLGGWNGMVRRYVLA